MSKEEKKDEFYNLIGKKLKKLRKEMGYSQVFISQELGITRQAIINIEAGKRKIDSFELFKFIDLYNININFFILKKENINLQNAISHLKDKEKKALFEFQKICDDYKHLLNTNKLINKPYA